LTQSFERLFGSDRHAGAVRRADLPAALRERYGGDLVVPLVDGRPTVIANFVETLDGVVSFDPDSGKGGGEVSGFFEPDRLVMALLRSIADVVLVGAGTVRADPRGRWIAASVHPPTATETAALRDALGLAPQPTTVVVTASGDVDLSHPGMSDPAVPVLVVTTEAGFRRVRAGAHAEHVEVIAAGQDAVDPHVLVQLLAARGAQLVLCEGGPHLMGDLVSAGLLDELFLTVAPQLAGRADNDHRLTLVEGRAFEVDDAAWGELVDVRRAGSHLFNRYRFGGTKQ
jgi:riboflavin biosynthesis pyrimidine reductase